MTVAHIRRSNARDKSLDVQGRAAALTELAGISSTGTNGSAKGARNEACLAALETENPAALGDDVARARACARFDIAILRQELQ